MKHRAFTLLEMLLATTLATVLMAGVLLVLSTIARDQKRLFAIETQTSASTIADCLQRDLANAETMACSGNGRSLILVGHGAVDERTLKPTGRLARITYHAADESKSFQLVRDQTLLDDPARPARWRELVATGITGVWVIPNNATPAEDIAIPVPARARLHIESAATPISEDLWLK